MKFTKVMTHKTFLQNNHSITPKQLKTMLKCLTTSVYKIWSTKSKTEINSINKIHKELKCNTDWQQNITLKRQRVLRYPRFFFSFLTINKYPPKRLNYGHFNCPRKQSPTKLRTWLIFLMIHDSSSYRTRDWLAKITDFVLVFLGWILGCFTFWVRLVDLTKIKNDTLQTLIVGKWFLVQVI